MEGGEEKWRFDVVAAVVAFAEVVGCAAVLVVVVSSVVGVAVVALDRFASASGCR